MKTKTSQNAHRGSDFRDFLAGKVSYYPIYSAADDEVIDLGAVKLSAGRSVDIHPWQDPGQTLIYLHESDYC